MKRVAVAVLVLLLAVSAYAMGKGSTMTTEIGKVRPILGSVEVSRSEQDGKVEVLLYVTDENRFNKVLLTLSQKQARDLGMMLAMAAAEPEEKPSE